MSPRWIKDILRRELGFKGVVFTDDMSMAGAAVAGDIVERSRRALDAGSDMVLICNSRPSVVTVLDKLEVRAVAGFGRAPRAHARRREGTPRDTLMASDRMAAVPRNAGALLGAAITETRSRSDDARPRMNDWSVDIWRSFIDSSPDGVAVCDAAQQDCPVVYVNAAFCQLTGYQSSSLMGTNLRTAAGRGSPAGSARADEGVAGARRVVPRAHSQLSPGRLAVLERDAAAAAEERRGQGHSLGRVLSRRRWPHEDGGHIARCRACRRFSAKIDSPA